MLKLSIALRLGITSLSLVALSACGRATPTPTPLPPTAAPAATATSTTAPTEAPTTAPTDTPTAAQPTAEAPTLAGLETTLASSLGITISTSTTYTIGIEGVRAFAVDNPIDATPLWVAYTYGLRSFSPLQNHVIALYTRAADQWQEITRVELADNGDPQNPALAPDYVADGDVGQVLIEPTHIWIQLEGGVGAHSGVYGLFSSDGASFTPQISAFNSSPGLAEVKDLNNDGIQEVVLDASDYYVFCYACGVRLTQYTIWRWDDPQMVEVTLSPLADAAPPQVRDFNQQIIALAQANLWQDVLDLLPEAATFSYSDPVFTWNLQQIELNGVARRDEATGDNSAFPLLTNVFYGDFAHAVDLMRDIGADGIFIPNSPLLAGTVAEGWEPTLADWITSTVDPALELKPDLAPAYFLRGWATYLKTQDEAAALADIQQAAELAPDDVLYAKSVDFLSG